jgi:hypothetical protein
MADCICTIENERFVKVCAKHKAEWDALTAQAMADARMLDEWEETMIKPYPNHSRRGTFERLGGPITWDPANLPTKPRSPEVVQVLDGDLTALM